MDCSADECLVVVKKFIQHKPDGEKILWKQADNGYKKQAGGGPIHVWTPDSGKKEVSPDQEDESGKEVGFSNPNAGQDKPDGEAGPAITGEMAGFIADGGVSGPPPAGCEEAVVWKPAEQEAGEQPEGAQPPAGSGDEAGVPAPSAGGPDAPPSGEESWEKMLARAVSLHQQGVAGDKEAVKKACELLEKARKLAPGNNVVEAYYGSVTSLLGRDATDPMERFNKAIKGLKILDRSVAADPDNVEIRTLRAYVCYRLPEKYFHRTTTAVEDFSSLAACYESNPGAFAEDLYCQVLYDLGVSFKLLGREREAESAWQKLLSVSGGSRFRDFLKKQGFLPSDPDPANGGGADPAAKPKPANGKKEEKLREGIKLREQALKGDAKSSRKALSFFKKAMEADPEGPLVMAYYADCLSLASRDSLDPGEMFSTPIKAAKILEEAVNKSPDDLRVRMIRAYHSFRLPEAFFRRTASAIADFEYLVNEYERDPSVFPEETYRQLLYDLGLSYQRLGLEDEASSTWEKLLSQSQDPKYREMIDRNLGRDLPVSPPDTFSPDNREALYEEGFRLHDLGVAGNREAAKKALELWQKAYEADPGDTLARGYYGSSMALVGRDSNTPNAIFGNAIKGLVHLNRAISRDRNNLRLRLLRGYLAYSLPEVFFHQTKRAIKDFKFLKMAYETGHSLFSAERYHKLLHDLGMAYQRAGDSEKGKKTWSKLAEISGDPKYRALLSERVDTDDEDKPQADN